jgi:type IV pilus assembly protein PilC
MQVFVWEGKNRNNIVQKGEMEATGVDMVRSYLNRLRITPTKIKKKPKDLFENVAFLQPKVTQRDVILFCRQFSTMIDAGLPIIQCMDILHAQQENATFKKMLKNIKEQVESGSTLADALKKYPKQFDDLFVNMVAAGEAGGILDTILRRLSAYMEKAAKLKSQVKGAMTYPIVTILIAVVVVAVIMVFVIPVFQEMFADMGGALPTPTLVVIAMSDFVKSKIHWLIIGLILFSVAFKKYYATEKGRQVVDASLLRLPVFGLIIRKVAVAKFTQTMGTMLSSGVAILEALDIVAKTSGNKTIERAI